MDAAAEVVPQEVELKVGVRMGTSSIDACESQYVTIVSLSNRWVQHEDPKGRKGQQTRDDRNLTLYPRADAYAYVMYDGNDWWVRDAERRVFPMIEDVLSSDLEPWILTCAEENPDFWLPVEQGCFIKLQAKKESGDTYSWTGIIPGGPRIPLPEAFLKAKFSADLLATCKETCKTVDCAYVGAAAPVGREGSPASATVVVSGPNRFTGGGEDYCVAHEAETPKPADGAHVGAAAPVGREGSPASGTLVVSGPNRFTGGGEDYCVAHEAETPKPADGAHVGAAAPVGREGSPASGTLVVSRPNRFAGGDKDYCVAHGAAMAVDLAGDPETADIIGGLAKSSIDQPAGTNRVKWVQNECAQKLQPFGWTTRKLKNAQQLTVENVLKTPKRGEVSVYHRWKMTAASLNTHSPRRSHRVAASISPISIRAISRSTRERSTDAASARVLS